MSVKITYFVHGTTTDNEQDLATGWEPGELSAKGREQAVELGKKFEEVAFDTVISSDLTRAIQSAELAFGSRCRIVHEKRLRECDYGDYTGQPASSFKENMEDFIATPFPNGESYEDVEQRIRLLLADIKNEYDGMHIALVAHQAPQLALDVVLHGRTWRQAIAEDWRKTKSWQPGWHYELT